MINGARYDMKLFLDQSERFVRTFYPAYLGPAGESPRDGSATGGQPQLTSPRVVSGPVKIVAALVNPMGADDGQETVTLVNAGIEAIALDGWFLVDKVANRYGIKDVTLAPGMATTIVLPRHSIQLSNKGGEIRLVNRAGSTAHLVTYSKAQADRQGETIIL